MSVSLADGTTLSSSTFMRRGTIGGANHEMTPLREGEEEEHSDEEVKTKTLDNGPSNEIPLPFANKRGNSRYRRGGIGTSILFAPDEKNVDPASDDANEEKNEEREDKENRAKGSQESLTNQDSPSQQKKNPTKKTRFKCSQDSLDKNSNHSTPRGSAKSSPALVRRQHSRRGGLGLTLNLPNEVSRHGTDKPANGGLTPNSHTSEHLNGDIDNGTTDENNEKRSDSPSDKLKHNQVYPVMHDEEPIPLLKCRARAPTIETCDVTDDEESLEKESPV